MDNEALQNKELNKRQNQQKTDQQNKHQQTPHADVDDVVVSLSDSGVHVIEQAEPEQKTGKERHDQLTPQIAAMYRFDPKINIATLYKEGCDVNAYTVEYINQVAQYVREQNNAKNPTGLFISLLVQGYSPPSPSSAAPPPPDDSRFLRGKYADYIDTGIDAAVTKFNHGAQSLTDYWDGVLGREPDSAGGVKPDLPVGYQAAWAEIVGGFRNDVFNDLRPVKLLSSGYLLVEVPNRYVLAQVDQVHHKNDIALAFQRLMGVPIGVQFVIGRRRTGNTYSQDYQFMGAGAR
jgi:hypothetical protein